MRWLGISTSVIIGRSWTVSGCIVSRIWICNWNEKLPWTTIARHWEKWGHLHFPKRLSSILKNSKAQTGKPVRNINSKILCGRVFYLYAHNEIHLLDWFWQHFGKYHLYSYKNKSLLFDVYIIITDNINVLVSCVWLFDGFHNVTSVGVLFKK